MLDGQFTAVQQAVGTARANQAGATFLRDFAAQAEASGLIARLIERPTSAALSVAPPIDPASLPTPAAASRWLLRA